MHVWNSSESKIFWKRIIKKLQKSEVIEKSFLDEIKSVFQDFSYAFFR